MTGKETTGRGALRWFWAVRPWAFPASVIPVAVGGAVVFYHSRFSAAVFIATLIGAVLVHAGANLANTYFDFKNRLDTPEHSDDRTLVDGMFSPASVYAGSLVVLLAAAAIGLALSARAGWPMLCIGAAGLALAYFYTAGKIRYKYRGLGEIGIFLCFGPFLVVGTAMIQTGEFIPWALLFSVPIGLHVAAILHSNNMRDSSNDKRAGAVTISQRLGERNSLYLYFFLIFAPYVFLAACLAGFSCWVMLAVLSLPAAWKLALDAKRHELSLLPQKTARFILLFGILLIAGIIAGTR